MTHILFGNRKRDPTLKDPARPPGFNSAQSSEPVQQPAPPPPVTKEVPMPAPVRSEDQRPRIDRVTVVIVNFKTPHLVKLAVTSLLSHYRVDTLVVDNGSRDDSASVIRALEQQRKCVTAVYNNDNLGHGPALNRAFRSVSTEFVFALDSDCEVLKGKFLEKLIVRMDKDSNLYAIGWRRWVDRRSGVPREWHLDNPPSKNFVAYAHPAASLYRLSMYRKLRPFIHHGAPALKNMIDAERRGFEVQSYPVFKFINHLKAGTRRMYDGRWDPKPAEKPKTWRKDADYPI